jgi:hypothetical protein
MDKYNNVIIFRTSTAALSITSLANSLIFMGSYYAAVSQQG